MVQELHRQTEISTCVTSEVKFMFNMIDGKALRSTCSTLFENGVNAQSSQCH